MTIYVGRPESADYSHVGKVFRVDSNGEQKELDPRFDLRNHSPTGFAWGYGGSGPAQLALAILADAGDDVAAQRHYQKFKFEKISSLPHGSWQIDAADVREWIEIREAEFLDTD